MINFNNRNIPSLFEMLDNGKGDSLYRIHPLKIIKEYIKRKPNGENHLFLEQQIIEYASYIDLFYLKENLIGYRMIDFEDEKPIFDNMINVKNSDITICDVYHEYRHFINSYYESIYMEERYKPIIDLYMMNILFDITKNGFSHLLTKEQVKYNIFTIFRILSYEIEGNRLDFYYKLLAKQIIDNSIYSSDISYNKDKIYYICNKRLSVHSYLDCELLTNICIEYLNSNFKDLLEESVPKDVLKYVSTGESIPIMLSVILYELKIRNLFTDKPITLSAENTVECGPKCDTKYKITSPFNNIHSQWSMTFSNPRIIIEDSNGRQKIVDIEEILSN